MNVVNIEKLKQLLSLHSINNAAFAKASQVSQSHISNILNQRVCAGFMCASRLRSGLYELGFSETEISSAIRLPKPLFPERKGEK